jgi:hypothetical protein
MAKWAIPEASSSEPSTAATCIAVPQHPHEASMVASHCSIAGMPNASQMQLPYQERSPDLTRKGVGTAEKGLAIKISPVPLCKTRTCPSARRCRDASTSSGGVESAEAVRAMVGGHPSFMTWS